MANRPMLTQATFDDLRSKGIEVEVVSRDGRRVQGIETRLVDALEAERVEMVICGFPPAAFPDEDILAWCADCRRAIVHRPHAPRTPVKVCAPCGLVRLQRGPR